MRIRINFQTPGAFIHKPFNPKSIFTFRFLEWMNRTIGPEKVAWNWKYEYRNERTIPGTGGNKGGWHKVPFGVIVNIKDERHVLMFKMKWGGEFVRDIVSA